MNGMLKIGQQCIEVPMFSDAALLRAGHGRLGEPLRELARELRRGGAPFATILLGAGYGERLADLAAAGEGEVLCLEPSVDRYCLLQRNAALLGGAALAATVGAGESAAGVCNGTGLQRAAESLAFSAVLERFPSFREARLLVSGGGQDGPSAVESALAWIGVRRPVMVLKVELTGAESADRWMRALRDVSALGYEAPLAFDSLDRPLDRLAPKCGSDLLAALSSTRCPGSGLLSATLFMGVATDQRILTRVCATLDARHGASDGHRIAVVRMDNLGDHVLGAGIFAALRARYPRSKVVAVVPASLAELYSRCPSVDALLTLPPFTSYLADRALWAQVGRHLGGCPKFDLVIHPRFAEDWYGAGPMCSSLAAAGARVLGFRQPYSPLPGYDPNPHYSELLQAPDGLHTARYASLLAEAATGRPAAAAPEVWFEPQDWRRIADHLALEPHGFVAVGIGASCEHKRPSLEIYRRLLARLLTEPHRVVLVGSSAETGFAEKLRASFADDGRIVSTAGELRLYEVAALLRHARLYIGPDAGPKHIAAAVHTPVVEVSWVPTDFPATSRGDPTAGRCWTAWNTVTRVVSPSRDAFERAARNGGLQQKPSTDVDPRHLDLAIDELLALGRQPAAAAVGVGPPGLGH